MPTTTEQVVHGLGVSPGLVCAPWLAFGAPVETSAEDPVGESVPSETARVRDALATVSGDLIGLVAAAGVEAGTPVGVCGEAASDHALAPVLVGLGVTILSTVAPSLGAVRARLAATDLDRCREMAVAARSAQSPQAARSAVAALTSGVPG